MAISRERLKKAAETKPSGDVTLLPQLTAAAEEMEEAKAQVDELEVLIKERKERYKHLADDVVPDLMEKAGLVGRDGKGSFTLRSGASIYLKNEIFVNIKKEDKKGLFAWLRKKRLGSMIKEDIPAQTLKAFCRERLEEDEELPPQVMAHYATSAVLLRTKQSKESK
jgi:hypothetical protein